MECKKHKMYSQGDNILGYDNIKSYLLLKLSKQNPISYFLKLCSN